MSMTREKMIECIACGRTSYNPENFGMISVNGKEYYFCPDCEVDAYTEVASIINKIANKEN